MCPARRPALEALGKMINRVVRGGLVGPNMATCCHSTSPRIGRLPQLCQAATSCSTWTHRRQLPISQGPALSPLWLKLSSRSRKHYASANSRTGATGERSDPSNQAAAAASQVQDRLSPQPIQPPALRKASKHENIYNVPNVLTATRLVAAPVLGYLIVQGDLKWALGLFFYAGVTDLIDGWWARRFKLQTVVGSVIDPMADKLLMTVMTISLAVKGLLPISLATLILGRDISLAIAAIYYRYASLPCPKTMARYWDFSLPSAQVNPTTVSKYNTFLQLMLIGGTLALPVLAAESAIAQPHSLQTGLLAFQLLVAGTTAWSGLSYAFLKDAVTIIGEDEVLQAKQGARGRLIIGVLFGSIVATSAVLAVLWDRYQKEKLETEMGGRQ